MRLGLHGHTSTPRTIRGLNSIFAFFLNDDSAGGKVRALHELHQLFNIDVIELFPTIEHVHNRIHDLAEIMRRNGRCHTHGNTCCAVHQKVWDSRRENARFFEGVIKIGNEFNRFFVQVEKNIERGGSQTRLGITHGRRRVSVYRTEVTLSIHKQCAHGKILRHTRHGFVHRRVTMRVIFTKHFTDDTSRFFICRIRANAHIIHRVQDAALHRFESIPRIGQGARHDDAHGVIKIRLLHLCIDIYFSNNTKFHSKSFNH